MSWKKYGSPYDPGHSGNNKIKRPQEQSERELHRLRGCADPSCPFCNPETAARSDRPSVAWGRPSLSFASLPSGWEDEMRRALMGSFVIGDASPTKEQGPPPSYKKAREAVAQWIITAPEQSFDDIVGNELALGQLRDAIKAPVEHKELYAAYGMKMPKGALLSGPPGCGKTMFARAAASEMRGIYGEAAEFISISGSELQSMYVGETEGRIKAIFTYAREYRDHHGFPLLVFMDEAEVLLPDRTGRVRRLASWEESQVATFLAEMDGMQESGAFVLLATNRPEVIDQAVLRDGRCDFKITVERPNADAVEVILQRNFTGILTGEDSVEALVFAALEGLLDPHKILLEAHAIGFDFSDGKFKELQNKHFLLEHIVSGAMCASIPARAKRYAFARDKVAGVPRGVLVADVVSAVNDLFEENRGLEHSFALAQFKAEFEAEAKEAANELLKKRK